MKKLLLAAAALCLPAPSFAVNGPTEHAMCGTIALLAFKANEGSGFEPYWRTEANRVLENMTAAFKTNGRTAQQAEAAANAEVDKVINVIQEDPVPHFVEGLFLCKNFGLINFNSTASK